MNQIVLFAIYAITLIVGIVGAIFLIKADRKGMFKFVTWFACTLVICFFILDLVSNPFTLSLIIALFVAFMAVKDGN